MYFKQNLSSCLGTIKPKERENIEFLLKEIIKNLVPETFFSELANAYSSIVRTLKKNKQGILEFDFNKKQDLEVIDELIEIFQSDKIV